MKALSLWQPWATLMAAGLKTIETRHWPTRYRGPLAIHAAKRRMSIEERELVQDWRNVRFLQWTWPPADLPYGAIIAVVELVDCISSSKALIGLPAAEIAFGDYSMGRWAWITRNLRVINPPIPYRGRQGLFEVPDEVIQKGIA